MPLQIRRGTTAQRLAITPLPGELIHDTTTGQLFVGNGSTVGGATTTGISTEDAQDATAALLTSGTHSGITFAYNDAAARIDATVTVSSTGPFDGDLTGSVFADDSTLLVDGTSGSLVGPLATSGFSTFGSNVTLQDGNITIVRNTYSSSGAAGFSFQQHHNTADAVNFTFVRSRGTGLAPTTLLNGDDIIDLNFVGHNGTAFVAGAGISATVDGTPNVNGVPTKFGFTTNNGTATALRAELSATGIWKIDSLGSFSGTTINVVDNNTITLGDVRLSQDGLSTINTNASLIVSANGSGSVDIESVRIQGNTISTTDSSGITVSQAATFSSNLTVDGTLTVGDSVVQNSVNRDYISTTLQTQGVNRVVNGVQNGTYVQLASSTSETYTTISYNSTIYKGCRATFKVSQANNVHISEVLLANSSAAVTIVNAQAAAATSGATNLISSITADYDSATGTIRLRPITSTSVTAGFNLLWTVSYQLFT